MNRYHFDAIVTPEDLEETYLPAFKVRDITAPVDRAKLVDHKDHRSPLFVFRLVLLLSRLEALDHGQ